MQNKKKYCYKCRAFKNPEEFGKNNRNRDGLRHECRSCRSLYRKTYKGNPEAKKARLELGRKTCCKCKTDRPLTEYYKSNRTPDGFRRECRHCHAVYYEQRRARQKSKKINRRTKSIGIKSDSLKELGGDSLMDWRLDLIRKTAEKYGAELPKTDFDEENELVSNYVEGDDFNEDIKSLVGDFGGSEWKR